MIVRIKVFWNYIHNVWFAEEVPLHFPCKSHWMGYNIYHWLVGILSYHIMCCNNPFLALYRMYNVMTYPTPYILLHIQSMWHNAKQTNRECGITCLLGIEYIYFWKKILLIHYTLMYPTTAIFTMQFQTFSLDTNYRLIGLSELWLHEIPCQLTSSGIWLVSSMWCFWKWWPYDNTPPYFIARGPKWHFVPQQYLDITAAVQWWWWWWWWYTSLYTRLLLRHMNTVEVANP